MFLLPFKRCTARFECNSSDPENYVFFAYNAMYDHINDIKSKLESDTGIGTFPIQAWSNRWDGEPLWKALSKDIVSVGQNSEIAHCKYHVYKARIAPTTQAVY